MLQDRPHPVAFAMPAHRQPPDKQLHNVVREQPTPPVLTPPAEQRTTPCAPRPEPKATARNFPRPPVPPPVQSEGPKTVAANTRPQTDTKTVPHAFIVASNACSPEWGIPRARALATRPPNSRTVDRRRRPRVFTETLLLQLQQPDDPVTLMDRLPPPQQKQMEADFEVFLAQLPAQQRERARQGHRLTKDQVSRLLRRFTADEREEKGLRFSFENSPFRDDDDHRRVRASPSIRSAQHPTPDPRPVLMDLWEYADPLLLELCLDGMINGINIGYQGDFKTTKAPNMSKSATELRELADLWIVEMEEGRAKGFYTRPPFACYRTIPAGFVPKKDSTQRPVDNYSAGGDDSVNATSDRVRAAYPHFEKAVANLHRAGEDGRLMSWDVSKAYQNNKIRECDQWTTVCRLPFSSIAHRPDIRDAVLRAHRKLFGDRAPPPTNLYAFRTHCPFGLAASGHRWHLTGMVINTAYTIAHHTMTVNNDDTVRFPRQTPDPRMVTPHKRDAAGDMRPTDDTILSTAGRRLLALAARKDRNDDAVDLHATARNVDDFMQGFADAATAHRTAVAVVWLHARYRVQLKQSKFTHPTKAIDFHGFDFIVPYTIAYQKGKQQRLLNALQRIAKARPLYTHIESAIGSLVYLSTIFPAVRGVTPALYRVLNGISTRAGSTKKGSTPDKNISGDRPRGRGQPRLRTAKRNMSTEALAVVRFCQKVVKEGPAATSTFVRASRSGAHATAIIHVDWCAKQDTTGTQGWGAVCLSHGLWCGNEVPEPFTKAWGNSSPTMEAFAVWFALRAFAAPVAHQVVLVFSDNLPFVQAFRKYNHHHVSTSPGLATALRAITLEVVRISIVLRIEYVPTTKNLADPISRGQPQDTLDRLGSLRFSGPASKVKTPSLPLPCF